jgi:hypothetical protein
MLDCLEDVGECIKTRNYTVSFLVGLEVRRIAIYELESGTYV